MSASFLEACAQRAAALQRPVVEDKAVIPAGAIAPRSEDSLFAEQLIAEELAAMTDRSMAESLALALRLQAEEWEDAHDEEGEDDYESGDDEGSGEEDIDVDAMSYEELLALGDRIGSVNVGATDEQVNAVLLPLRDASARSLIASATDNSCAVCLEPFTFGAAVPQLRPGAPGWRPDQRPAKLGCGHIFHAECARQHLRVNRSCPVCRAESCPLEPPTPGSG